MEIRSSDIYEYLQHNSFVYDTDTLQGLIEIYKIDPSTNYGKSQIYIIDKLAKNYIQEKERLESIYQRRKDTLNELKQLELPEQRSPEWYEMRKEMLTASSMASALDKCHFTTRDELLLGKIISKAY